MAISWTLEKELCGLVDASSTGEALWRLGLAESPAVAPVLEEQHGWRRGGAETFVYHFKVIGSDAAHDVVLKAVTAFSLTRTLNQLSNEWLKRRRLLAEAGINTPTLYHAGRALLVEQHVGTKLATWLLGEPDNGHHLADQVMHIAAVMDRHGFAPINPFGGLRTDGEKVYVVDFGQDLGPPGVRQRRGKPLLNEAKRWLATAGQSIDRRRAEAIYAFHLDGGAKACHEQRSS